MATYREERFKEIYVRHFDEERFKRAVAMAQSASPQLVRAIRTALISVLSGDGSEYLTIHLEVTESFIAGMYYERLEEDAE